LNLESLANLGEFLGGIAVLVSLIYLAFQIRANTSSLRTEMTARTIEKMSDMQRSMSMNGELNYIVIKSLLDPRAVDLQERTRFTWWLTELFTSFEYLFIQYKDGLVKEEMWKRWYDNYRWWLSFPGIADWWASKPTPFTPEFTTLVDTMIEEGYEYEKPGAWDDFLAGKPLDHG
jgi:hypothetical protein